MQISLRKANALQVSINEALKALSFNRNVSLNEFQDAESVILTESQKLANSVQRRSKLLQALYSIRKSVSAANVNSGVDNVLADIALLEKDIVFYASLAKETERLDTKVLQGKLDKLANRKEEAYYGPQTVDTSVLTENAIKVYSRLATKAKKEKQKLQDELLELNVRTTITLGSETVQTLTDAEII